MTANAAVRRSFLSVPPPDHAKIDKLALLA